MGFFVLPIFPQVFFFLINVLSPKFFLQYRLYDTFLPKDEAQDKAKASGVTERACKEAEVASKEQYDEYRDLSEDR